MIANGGDKDSRRAREVRTLLAERLNLAPDAVSRAVVAFLDGVEGRLPRGTAVALLSWLPQSWALLAKEHRGGMVRGGPALRARVVEAGIPSTQSGAFICELLRVIGERVGTPLAEQLKRRVPELAQIERETIAEAGGARSARSAD